jgi:DNA-binding transcriptional regulator GbsR (MarR family)
MAVALLASMSVISYISVMTEITGQADDIAPAAKRFILHWGDMGSRWGVNRSIGQIHALLYLSEQPMTAEAIADTLGIARSNVSNSLKELLAWRLIRRVSSLGDRRDYFEAEGDLWEMLFRIVEGRKEREIDPAIAALRACVEEADRDPKLGEFSAKRLVTMLAFVESLDRWYGQIRSLPKAKLAGLLKLGARVAAVLARKRVKFDHG